jgi:hypothetical protein
MTTSSKQFHHKSSIRQRAIAEGYRSGLEEVTASDLVKRGIPYKYEELVILYVKPERTSKYTPDFVLENGLIIETKGRFVTADRQRHILIKAQHPEYDIRFVFSNSKSKVSKLSSTTYGMWCDKHGFKYADRVIPEDWLNE